MTATFWLEPTSRVLNGLRRYASGVACTGPMGYHNAMVFTGTSEARYNDQGVLLQVETATPHGDLRWPTHCVCGYAFDVDDTWQDWQERVWTRTDTDEIRLLRAHVDADSPIPAAEPGACWDATWLHYPCYIGPDGITLMVRCPDGHDWNVDSRASNCTLPDDNVHKCWVRHGDPRDCHVTVDKNGVTCSAGAGSIQTPNWHGFLRDGQLVVA